MKKLYKTPEVLIVELNGGNICQTLVVGSGGSDATTGDGTDLVKEDVSMPSYNVWDDDWRE